MSAATTQTGLRTGFAVQTSVVGALLMRELHTRYGRENIGYLWLFLEPALLAIMVSALHVGAGSVEEARIGAVPFAILGYTSFIMFRSMFTRADAILEANAPLLYHRQVTIFDMVLARGLLELAATVTVIPVLLGIAMVFDVAAPPARPLALLAGIGLLWLWSFGLSLLVCAAANDNRLVSKFVHPISYILLPLSGAFYRLDWLPSEWREIMAFFPMTQMFELIRHGQFSLADAHHVQPVYLGFWCLALVFLGLLAVRAVRARVHIG
ncbi:MAG: ABC transporter permease [Pseudomonadota bacterium]